MTIHQAQQQLLFQLYHVYDNREAANIADWVMEHITGWKKIDRIMHKQVPLLPDKIALLEQYTQELLAHKPVQYVLHEAWFAGMPLYVDENVLIPRPETEELVEWVVSEARSRKSVAGSTKTQAPSELRPPGSDLSILDIGTGSGCIPIALKKKLPAATIYACDISEGALAVAKKNAVTQGVEINFLQVDFLKNATQLPTVDIIVSNPPYVPVSNKETMQLNVLQYEPHLALFVENDDPLLFYKAIADFATGVVYVEIHEDLGEQIKALFAQKGCTAELRKDLQGKDRMVKAVKTVNF